jgi:hypothetical protein
VLKDGRTMRVSFFDAARARATSANAALHDGHGGTAMLGRKPGWVTTVDAEKMRRNAYEASKAALQVAWRTPAAPPVRSDAALPDPRRPISFADAERIRFEAYRAMCAELQDAWRTKSEAPAGIGGGHDDRC